MSEPSSSESKMILPTVLRMIAAANAGGPPEFDGWALHNPWHTRFVDAFPFREDSMAVYIQVSGGLGPIHFGIELLRLETTLNGEIEKSVKRAVHTSPYVFHPDENRLRVFETAFFLQRVTFRSEAYYRFRVFALVDDAFVPLPDGAVDVRFLQSQRKV